MNVAAIASSSSSSSSSSSNSNLRSSDKLLRTIGLKNLQLRRLASVLLVDVDFLRFYDRLEQFEYALLQADDEKDSIHALPEVHRVLSLLELRLQTLRWARADCLQLISLFPRELQQLPVAERRRSFIEGLENTLQELQRRHERFRAHIEQVVWFQGDIYRIGELERDVARTDQLARVVHRNHLNCVRLLLTTDNCLEQTVLLVASRLKWTVNSLLTVALVQFVQLLENMAAEEGGNFRELHAKLQDEIRQSLLEMQVNESELASLRQRLFPSGVSLPTQRTITIEQRDQRGIALQEQLRAIDLLEGDKQEIEGRVAQLIEQRETIQGQLNERKGLLEEGLREIARLERLIEQIEREISDGTVQFQEETKAVEQRRCEVLEDQDLPWSERKRLLEQCETELSERRKSHTSNMNLLEGRRQELGRISTKLAQDVGTFREEIAERQRSMVEEMQRKRRYATPSEMEVFEASLLQQQAEHAENLALLDRARSRSEYLQPRGDSTTDLNEEPTATTTTMLEDENGVYYLDKFGRKIYHKQYFSDPRGSYYIDVTGARVYGHDEQASREENHPTRMDETAPPSQAQQPNGSPTSAQQGEATGGSFLLDSQSVADRRERIASDVAYIEETLGKTLRKALATVARLRPSDPVGYLADYLALRSENGIDLQKRQQLLERLRSAEKPSPETTRPEC